MIYHRQGRIGTYAIFGNHEAMQAGLVFALADRDWIFPAYRESAVGLLRGMPCRRCCPGGAGIRRAGGTPGLQRRLDLRPDRDAGAACGRIRMGLAPEGRGSRRAHAVRRRRDLGGRVSRGRDVRRRDEAPVVLLCNNNQWAISTPLSSRRRRSPWSTRQPATEYRGCVSTGLTCSRLRGDARRRRACSNRRGPDLHRSGHLPCGPHATADDPSIYIDAERVEEERENECVGRYERYLERLGMLTEARGGDQAGRARAHAGWDRCG